MRKNLSSLQQRLRDLIDDSKQKYFLRLTQKLNTIQKSTKAYWALLRFFLNNRKIPVTPPLFHNNKFVTDFKEKAELFNSFFAKQCSLIKNGSKLPPRLYFLTDKRLSMVKLVVEGLGGTKKNKQPKFLKLLTLVHLRNYFIEALYFINF